MIIFSGLFLIIVGIAAGLTIGSIKGDEKDEYKGLFI